MDAVREFVLRHHTLSEAVVANVQMAGTFVPGRWGEWEVPFEAGMALLNSAVLAEDLVVHEHLRSRAPNTADEAIILRTLPRRGIDAAVCFALSLLRAVEAPVEMVCAKYATARRWPAVWIIEAVKALLKLVLLGRRRGRMLLVQGHPLRSTLNTLPMMSSKPAPATAPSPTAAPSAALSVTPALPPLRAAIVAAELAHIARPLVHLAALHRYGARAWTPLLLAAGADVASRVLSGVGQAGEGAPGKGSTADDERRELVRRQVAWLWYLLRDPLWPALQQRLAWLRVLTAVPVLGFGAQLVKDMLDTLTRFYFFTSAT